MKGQIRGLEGTATCIRCGVVQPTADFPQRRGYPHSYCRPCKNASSSDTPSHRAQQAMQIIKALERRDTGRMVHLVDIPKVGDYRRPIVQYPMLVERACGACGTSLGYVPWRQGRYHCEDCKHTAERRYKQRPEVRLWERTKLRMVTRPSRPRMRAWRAALDARWAYYAGRCYLCGGEADTWDHVKPLIAGGHPTLPSNLRPACRECNSRKSGGWAVRN